MSNGQAAEPDEYKPGVILVRASRLRACRARCPGSARRRRLPPAPEPPAACPACPTLPPLKVTGGAGFIGSHVVARLIQQHDYRVRGGRKMGLKS